MLSLARLSRLALIKSSPASTKLASGASRYLSRASRTPRQIRRAVREGLDIASQVSVPLFLGFERHLWAIHPLLCGLYCFSLLYCCYSFILRVFLSSNFLFLYSHLLCVFCSLPSYSDLYSLFIYLSSSCARCLSLLIYTVRCCYNLCALRNLDIHDIHTVQPKDISSLPKISKSTESSIQTTCGLSRSPPF